MIGEVFKILRREIFGLEFLKHQDVRAGFAQVAFDMLKPRVDGIHVPGDDFHAAKDKQLRGRGQGGFSAVFSCRYFPSYIA